MHRDAVAGDRKDDRLQNEESGHKSEKVGAEIQIPALIFVDILEVISVFASRSSF